MSYRNRSAIQNFVVYHLIFFFILTPFLASCGGGSSSDSNTPTALTEEQIVANAVEDQNRSAMTAIAQTVEMLTVIDNARSLIEDTFGTLNPTAADIQAYVENNSEEATNLLAQLDTELENVRQAAESLVESIEEMEEMEDTISSSLYGTGGSTSEGQRRNMAFVLDDFLIAGAILGIGLAFGLGVYNQSKAVEYDDDDDIGEQVTKSVGNWAELGKEGGKATATSVVTTVGSYLSGTLGFKKVKLISDTVGVIDNINTANKGAIALRRCQNNDGSDSEDPSLSFRKNMEVDYESLEAGDIYLGTPDEDSVFHNVPPGNWTFVVFIDGHLRTVTGCINVGEDESDTIIEVEVEPVPIDEIDELLENTPDETIACSDINDCEDGYICYLGFCEPESDFPMGSSSYVGHWRIIAENTTSNYWVADTLMMDTGRFNLQIYLWGTELGSVQRGIWSYNTRYNTLTLVDDNGSEIISGPINWENQNTDFWQTGTWAGSTEQKRFAWLKQEDDDCPCDGPTCPTRCPD